MSNIVQLKKKGINEYPITKPEAVIDSEGKTVSASLKDLNLAVKEKLSKKDVATINGKSITDGGNIIIEGSGEGGTYKEYDDTELKNQIKTISDKVNTKQDSILDIEAIRSGAEKGSTAIQKIKTINNQSIVGEGNVEIKAEAEIMYPESVAFSPELKMTGTTSRVVRLYYDISTNYLFAMNTNAEPFIKVPILPWLFNRFITESVLNIIIFDPVIGTDGYHTSSVLANGYLIDPPCIQFDYLDKHYTLTYNYDTENYWDVTTTPIMDPVVWKYLCDPIRVYDGATIPQDVLTTNGTLKYSHPGMYRVGRDGLNIDINYIVSSAIYTRYMKNNLVTNYIVYFDEPNYVWRLVEEEEA